MPSADASAIGASVVPLGTVRGERVIAVPTPLTRLNFFDGLFLRAELLGLEARYARELVASSNAAAGAGVVYGLNVARRAAEAIEISSGLAADGLGRLLLLTQPVILNIADLLAASRPPVLRLGTSIQSARGAAAELAKAAPGPRASVSIYLIAVAHAEESENEAGATIAEGLRIAMLPLQLRRALRTSSTIALDAYRHLRSLLASAYFADELAAGGTLVSARGLTSTVWCLGAASDAAAHVPLAVVARAGEQTLFVDPWIVRRERITPPSRRYWAGAFGMRPLEVFLAQVLQFQCQLNAALGVTPGDQPEDPCEALGSSVRDTTQYLLRVEQLLGKTLHPADDAAPPASGVSSTAPALLATPAGSSPARLMAKTALPRDADTLAASLLKEVEVSPATVPAKALPALTSFVVPGGATRLAALNRQLLSSLLDLLRRPASRGLLERGIVELPPAGYLPVAVGAEPTVNEQVRALLGAGLDLRFCAVPSDVVAHAFEQAQHLDRISLLQGLDDRQRLPEVDVLVPDGRLRAAPGPAQAYEVKLQIAEERLGAAVFAGVGRGASSEDRTFRMAVLGASDGLIDRLLSLLGAGPSSPFAIAGTLDAAPLLDPTSSSAFLHRALGLDFAAGPAVPPEHAAWVEIHCDGALSELAPGSRTSLSGRLVVAERTDAPRALDIAFSGPVTMAANDVGDDGHARRSATLRLVLTPMIHGSGAAAPRRRAAADAGEVAAADHRRPDGRGAPRRDDRRLRRGAAGASALRDPRHLGRCGGRGRDRRRRRCDRSARWGSDSAADADASHRQRRGPASREFVAQDRRGGARRATDRDGVRGRLPREGRGASLLATREPRGRDRGHPRLGSVSPPADAAPRGHPAGGSASPPVPCVCARAERRRRPAGDPAAGPLGRCGRARRAGGAAGRCEADRRVRRRAPAHRRCGDQRAVGRGHSAREARTRGGRRRRR